ncbi:uncharacterized protein LOC115928170 [Strongylocentrotus purpuratus]|uniref:Uncharacterized protein n=1 Tax=Strongylocentrotus purpuratus TaxID=7668 RepID=A0A7M7PH90_STRPU|nr:uncharacterized protein LOC115928170 [Strongylocentrotus purpuratus]
MSKLQTFSQLFNQMIEFLVDHHLSKHIPSSGIVEGKLGEHCSDIRPHLIHIGCTVFQGLLERRLVFTEKEFQSYPESIDVGCKIGVLTREKKILPMRDRRNTPNSVVRSVQFPHKLFQEYLSGMYLASLYNSNRNEYDGLIAYITPESTEYRYLLYFTSAQQKEVGLDIVSHLIAFEPEYNEDFVVDVAYESQDQAVAKAVADHLSTTSRKTLKITEEMQAHTVSGNTFIMNHREVDDLIIYKPCGRTASEDLAEFMCSSRSLRSVTIDLTGTMHDVFYSVLANIAVDSKVSEGSDELSSVRVKRNFKESAISDKQVAPKVEVPRDSYAEARTVTIEPSIMNEQMSQDQAQDPSVKVKGTAGLVSNGFKVQGGEALGGSEPNWK